MGLSAKEKICFIDTNIVAHWVMSSGGASSFLIDRYGLHADFERIYNDRYSTSVSFVDDILSGRFQDEFYISNLCLRELFSAVRDELRSILLFKKGVPISRWRNPAVNPTFEKKEYHELYKIVLKAIDMLFENNHIRPIEDIQPDDVEEYWDVYSSILFLCKDSQTQDVILLTTSVFNEVDIFITNDERLIRSSKKVVKEGWGMDLVKPQYARQLLKK